MMSKSSAPRSGERAEQRDRSLTTLSAFVPVLSLKVGLSPPGLSGSGGQGYLQVRVVALKEENGICLVTSGRKRNPEC